jgi:hypothetical protein
MAIKIEDGTGTGRRAKVDSNNRIETSGLAETVSNDAAIQGSAYNVNTGTLALTSGSKSAVVYLKNTGTNNIVIPKLFYLFGANTGGSGEHLVQVERNPTGGTIVTGASTQTPVNRNFSSQNTLTADSYKGAEGSTLTGGTVIIESLFTSEGRAALDVGAIVLAKGNSIGITITPKTSTTAMNVQFAMEIYEVV